MKTKFFPLILSLILGMNTLSTSWAAIPGQTKVRIMGQDSDEFISISVDENDLIYYTLCDLTLDIPCNETINKEGISTEDIYKYIDERSSISSNPVVNFLKKTGMFYLGGMAFGAFSVVAFALFNDKGLNWIVENIKYAISPVEHITRIYNYFPNVMSMLKNMVQNPSRIPFMLMITSPFLYTGYFFSKLVGSDPHVLSKIHEGDEEDDSKIKTVEVEDFNMTLITIRTMIEDLNK